MTFNIALLKSFTHSFQHILTMLLTLPATVGCCHMMNVVDMALESAETTLSLEMFIVCKTYVVSPTASFL